MVGKCPTKLLDLITRAEKAVYDRWGLKTWGPADLFCTTAFCFPEVVSEKKEYHVSVELNGLETRGMYVVDYKMENKPNSIYYLHFDECTLKTKCCMMAALKSYKHECGAG